MATAAAWGGVRSSLLDGVNAAALWTATSSSDDESPDLALMALGERKTFSANTTLIVYQLFIENITITRFYQIFVTNFTLRVYELLITNTTLIWFHALFVENSTVTRYKPFVGVITSKIHNFSQKRDTRR
jgi:hypothetical protein